MSTPFALSKIGQIAMTARDVDRATAFYRDTLGLPFLFSAPGMSFFQAGEVRLMLALPEPKYDHPGSVLYFEVPDIGAAHAALSSRGVTFVRDPFIVATMPTYDLWMTFFDDTEGNTLALMSHVPR
jgi:methylmalonyl-CoA/ethylmalonyl-CoA epimerase